MSEKQKTDWSFVEKARAAKKDAPAGIEAFLDASERVKSEEKKFKDNQQARI